MKRLLTLTLVVSLLVLSLVSCDAILGDVLGGEQTETGNTVWSPELTPVIVTDESAEEVAALRQHLSGLTGSEPELRPTSAAATANEIIVGNSERGISKKANAHLDAVAESIEDYAGNEKSSYVIYAEGGTLAIVYTNVYAKDAAITYIKENYKDATAAIADGVVAKTIFDTEDFIAHHRQLEQDKAFATIVEALGAEAADKLREIYALYGTEIYVWLANLYDPEGGGFYYSNSARNTVGFLPDLESTAQAFNLINTSGLADLYGGSWTNMLSEEAKATLLSFVRDMQDPNGYFFHPQWGKNVGTSRRGRDLGWATRIITSLGAAPYYDAANGVKGEESLGTTPAPTAFALTAGLTLPTTVAVSKVVPASTNPELESEEAFRAYLESLNLYNNSYSQGNMLNARAGEISNAGLLHVIRDYLTEIQNPVNGLWDDEVSYDAINGLMKLSGFFNPSNPFPNVMNAVDSTMEILMLDMIDDLPTICFVYNPWRSLLTIKQCLTEEEIVEVEARLKKNASALFSKTFTKLALFRKEDGAFSMNPEASASMSQGVVAAVPDSRESDVNASEIGVITVLDYMIPCFGLKAPRMFYKYDSLYFMDIFNDLGVALKDSGATEEPEVITFREYDPEMGEEEHGMVLYPHTNMLNIVGDTTINPDDLYRYFRSGIVDDPAGSGEKVLCNEYIFYGEENDKISAWNNSATQINIVNSSIPGNCYVLDVDVYFESGHSVYPDDDPKTVDALAPIAYIDFASQNMSFRQDQSSRYEWKPYVGEDGKNYLALQESYWYYGKDQKQTVLADALPVGEWFNLRLEFYKVPTEDGSDIENMYIKCYINDEFRAECITGRYVSAGYFINNIVDCIRFAPYRKSGSKMYYNNIYVAKENKTFQFESEKVQ